MRSGSAIRRAKTTSQVRAKGGADAEVAAHRIPNRRGRAPVVVKSDRTNPRPTALRTVVPRKLRRPANSPQRRASSGRNGSSAYGTRINSRSPATLRRDRSHGPIIGPMSRRLRRPVPHPQASARRVASLNAMNGLASPRTCRRSCADRLVPRRLQAGANPSGFLRAWFSARQSRLGIGYSSSVMPAQAGICPSLEFAKTIDLDGSRPSPDDEWIG